MDIKEKRRQQVVSSLNAAPGTRDLAGLDGLVGNLQVIAEFIGQMPLRRENIIKPISGEVDVNKLVETLEQKHPDEWQLLNDQIAELGVKQKSKTGLLSRLTMTIGSGSTTHEESRANFRKSGDAIEGRKHKTNHIGPPSQRHK